MPSGLVEYSNPEASNDCFLHTATVITAVCPESQSLIHHLSRFTFDFSLSILHVRKKCKSHRDVVKPNWPNQLDGHGETLVNEYRCTC